MRVNVAIDGPSAAGKSTIAKILAKNLNYIHLDTGAMYRCVAYKAQLLGIEITDEKQIAAFLPSTTIAFDSFGNVYLDHVDVTNEIRNEDISWLSSAVSTLLSVREDMVRRQQFLAEKKGIIMDGRDIGTVVLPDAEVKIFLTADVLSRAKRRYQDMVKLNKDITLEEIEADIRKRDLQDETREHSPLIKAADAIEIDTTAMTIEEVAASIMNIIQTKGKESKL